ncbi:MAG: alpha/beta fold hydrolase [Puniceicoccaceae bacterium]|nr:MAG: alpha/beta fold hydrolase [Puniceicoccaceae bacterium]
MPKPFLRILLYVVMIYGGLLVSVAAFQRSLIYYPSTDSEERMISIAEYIGMEAWLDGDGHIIGWKDESAGTDGETAGRVVVFHGNAGHALHRSYYRDGLRSLPEEAGRWRVYVFEYPGYGAREGRPSEAAIKRAADEAVQSLLETADGEPVYLIGESLGSGVASYLAGKYPDAVGGVLMVTPFTTLADVGRQHYPFLPVAWLLRDNYDNLAALEAYGGPVAVLLAENDRVVPAELGRSLYEQYAGPKRLWVQTGRGHNDLDMSSSASWWPEVFLFLKGGFGKV